MEIQLQSSSQRKQPQMQEVLVVVWFRPAVLLSFHSVVTGKPKRPVGLCSNLSLPRKVLLEFHK